MRRHYGLKGLNNMRYRAALRSLLIATLLQVLPGHSIAESSWLNQMIEATQTLSYEGSFLYARGSQIQLMNIRHRVTDAGREERIWHINGLPMEIIRINEMLTCYHPEGASVDLEHTIPSGPFAHVFKKSLMLGLESYQVEHLGKDRVSERKSDLILLMPNQADRYSYRLWLDEETHLLLRSEIVALDMEVLEQFQFVQIELNPVFADHDFKPKLTDPSLSHVEIIPAVNQNNGLLPKDFNWQLGWLPEGFKLNQQEAGEGSQSMLNYSDGLSSFSLFFEPISMGMPIGEQSMGATWAVTRHNYAYSMTLIGELPLSSAERILSAIKPN